jgi:hypothetical protein
MKCGQSNVASGMRPIGACLQREYFCKNESRSGQDFSVLVLLKNRA